jgi:hypothetical protein
MKAARRGFGRSSPALVLYIGDPSSDAKAAGAQHFVHQLAECEVPSMSLQIVQPEGTHSA